MNLKKRIEELERIVKQQEEIIKVQNKRIEELESLVKAKQIPSFVKEEVKQEPKQSGQKEGHVGYSRYIPERIDYVKEHNPDKCPKCNRKLSGIQDIRERVITDAEVKIVNTKHIIYRKYCNNCAKIVEEPIKDALPNARFSLRLMLLIMFMKIGIRIPSNKIIEFLGILGLKISDGEIYNILAQLKNAFGDYYKILVKKIQEAAAKHIDETGWRINGINNWLWIFINKEVALYVVEKQRSSAVPKKVLGSQRGKVVTTDRHSAYNILVEETGCLQQVCWTHLLRNSKDLAEHYPEAKYIHKRMKYIFKKAKEGKTPKEKLLHWIDLFANRAYTSKEVFRFIKSICRTHREDLFRFIDNPEISPSNNLAERGLRHAVVIRKVSGGSRSGNGADTTAKLLSVIQTMKIQEGNIIENMVDLLQKGK
jgi:ribosomal protein L34E/transposase-like protein